MSKDFFIDSDEDGEDDGDVQTMCTVYSRMKPTVLCMYIRIYVPDLVNNVRSLAAKG